MVLQSSGAFLNHYIHQSCMECSSKLGGFVRVSWTPYVVYSRQKTLLRNHTFFVCGSCTLFFDLLCIARRTRENREDLFSDDIWKKGLEPIIFDRKYSTKCLRHTATLTRATTSAVKVLYYYQLTRNLLFSK